VPVDDGGPSRTRTLDPLIKRRVGRVSLMVLNHLKSASYAAVSVQIHP